MNATLLILYMSLAVTLMRALLVKTHLAAPTCAHCGYPFERKELGERVCACGR